MHALQVQDIFEKDGDELALDDPKAFYGDFQILNPTDAQVPTTTPPPPPYHNAVLFCSKHLLRMSNFDEGGVVKPRALHSKPNAIC